MSGLEAECTKEVLCLFETNDSDIMEMQREIQLVLQGRGEPSPLSDPIPRLTKKVSRADAPTLTETSRGTGPPPTRSGRSLPGGHTTGLGYPPTLNPTPKFTWGLAPEELKEL